MRRLTPFYLLLATVLGLVAAVLGPAAGAAGAQSDGSDSTDGPDTTSPAGADDVVDVFKLTGLLDPINADALARRIDDAEDEGAVALVVQVNSGGSVLDGDSVDELRDRIGASTVPIGFWIGPAGSSAVGDTALLMVDADLIGISPGSDFGRLADDRPLPDGSPLEPLADEKGGVDEARAVGLPVTDAAILGDFLLAMEDQEIVPPITEVTTGDDGVPRRQTVVQVRFSQLPLLDQLLHTVASPPVAYLLLLAGLGLILLEFFTGGIGVAAVTGAVSVVLAGYGLGVLDTRPLGVALLVLAFLAFAVDVQTGVPRLWSALGAVGLTVGTFVLYASHSLSWLHRGIGIVLTLLLVLTGLPSLVRTRYSTTTLGREWMLGELGSAVTAIDPEGVVDVRGGRWKATTNRLTPIEAGRPARVVSIEGVVLEVEPEEGGAVDYRQMRRRRGDAADDAGPDEESAAAHDATGEASGDVGAPEDGSAPATSGAAEPATSPRTSD